MRQFFSKPRRLALALPAMLAAFFLFASAAGAAVSLTIGSQATLSARVLVTVPVTFSCGPYDQFQGTMGASVTVEQASGNQIATGTGAITNVVCDGTPHLQQVGVLATSRPFHGGQAVASAFLSVAAIVGGQFIFESGQAGPQVIAIHG
jgi:hypothetical protein